MANLYFRQLLAGRDFGVGDPIATQMQNFVYLIGDKDTGECLVVDPAWNVRDLLRVVGEDDMRVVGALATHYHPDHVGGSMYGFTVDGLSTLMELNPCRVHAHKIEVPGLRQVTGLEASDFEAHESHDEVKVGDIEIELLHTPGKAPEQILRRAQRVAGDMFAEIEWVTGICAVATRSDRVLSSVALTDEADLFTPYGATECLPVAGIGGREASRDERGAFGTMQAVIVFIVTSTSISVCTGAR